MITPEYRCSGDIPGGHVDCDFACDTFEEAMNHFEQTSHAVDWSDWSDNVIRYLADGERVITPDALSIGKCNAPRWICSGDFSGRHPGGIAHEDCTFTTDNERDAFTHFERTGHAVDDMEAN